MAVAKLIQAEIASKVEVNPSRSLLFYTKNPRQFNRRSSVRASHILIAFPEKADAAAKRRHAQGVACLKDVKAVKDFAALAKRNSQDPAAPSTAAISASSNRARWWAHSTTRFSLAPGTPVRSSRPPSLHIIMVVEKKAGRTVAARGSPPQVDNSSRTRTARIDHCLRQPPEGEGQVEYSSES